ncbi:MAG: hypothetical protein IPK83_21230 [Planctomycetes bacterium]|nr:hypothetical protein [Planctomycetota bacterium]
MSKSRRKDVDANRDTRDSDSQFDSGAAPDFCFPIKARKTPFEDIEQGAITFAMANARGTLNYDEYVCDMRVLEHVESAVSKRQKQIASSLKHYKTRKLVVLLAYRIERGRFTSVRSRCRSACTNSRSETRRNGFESEYPVNWLLR